MSDSAAQTVTVIRSEKDLTEGSKPEAQPATVSGTAALVDHDGNPVMAVGRLPPEDMKELRLAAQNYYDGGSGVIRQHLGLKAKATTFGFTGPQAMMQNSGCSSCAGARLTPEAHSVICDASLLIGQTFEDLLPAQNAAQKAIGSELPDGWSLPGRLWTSGILNRNSAMPYHKDRNNVKGSWSAMVIFRQFTRGGHLHLPNLSLEDGRPVVLECADGDVIFFSGESEMHGVTPITYRRDSGYRFSAVYYAIRTVMSCAPAESELARRRMRRTELETLPRTAAGDPK